MRSVLLLAALVMTALVPTAQADEFPTVPPCNGISDPASGVNAVVCVDDPRSPCYLEAYVLSARIRLGC